MKKMLTIGIAGLLFFATTASEAADFHIGPLVGVGAPSPISGQLAIKYKRFLGANLELGFLPEVGVPGIDNTHIHQEMFDAGLRVYPFGGAFFLGCGIGAQSITVITQQSQQGFTGNATASVNTTFVSPRLGWLYRFDFGLAIGADFAVQIPVGGSTAISVDNVNISPPKEVTDITDKVKTTPIPMFHLLELGYMF